MGSYDLSKKPCCSKEDTQPEPPPPVKQSVEIEVMRIVSGETTNLKKPRFFGMKRTRSLTSRNERPRWRWGKSTMSLDLYRNEDTTKPPRAAIVTDIEQPSDVCIRPVEGVAIGVSKSPFFTLLLPLPDASPFRISSSWCSLRLCLPVFAAKVMIAGAHCQAFFFSFLSFSKFYVYMQSFGLWQT